MPAAVISIGTKRRAWWWLLELARGGSRPVPYGILLVDEETGNLTHRLRELSFFDDLEEDEFDVLNVLPVDLDQKAREMGGVQLLESLEDSLSGFLRIGDRSLVAYRNADAAVNELFDEHVDSTVRPFVTHLPVYSLRAAATKFGDNMDAVEEAWVRVPANLRLTEGMFIAHVVGRSMEPLIPDGSACIFKAPVTGTRYGMDLLIEKFGETDFSSRYTVKRYMRQGALVESAEREQAIRLEPRNREFEAFDLQSDQFRVIARFVQVLPS